VCRNSQLSMGEGGESFKDKAFESGGEGLAKDDVVRGVNMGDVHLKVFVWVGFSRVTV